MISGSSRSSLLPQKWLILCDLTIFVILCDLLVLGGGLGYYSDICLQPFVFRLGKVYRHHWDAHTGFIQYCRRLSNMISFGRFVE